MKNALTLILAAGLVVTIVALIKKKNQYDELKIAATKMYGMLKDLNADIKDYTQS